MTRLKLMELDKQTIAFRVALTFFGLCWLLVLFVRLRLPDANQESARGLVVLLVGAACWAGAWQATLLARSWGATARVFRARQVPTTLWRLWLQDSLKSASQLWATLAVGVVSVLLPALSPFHVLTAVTLLALVVVLALLARLAVAGLMPRIWLWVFPLLVALGLSSTSYGGGLLNVVIFLNDMPWMLRLAVCLAVPALLAWLLQKWRSGPPQAMEVPLGLDLPVLMKRAKAWIAQYVPLTRSFGKESPAASGRHISVLQVFLTPFMFMAFTANGLAQPMGTALTVSHALMFGTILLLVSSNLVCKDLHWRLLLAPGGPHRGRLGWNIAVSTATIYMVGFTVIFGLLIAGACMFLDHPTQVFAFMAAQFSTLPFELMFAIALGTLIRGTRYPMRWSILLAALWLAFIFSLFMGVGMSQWRFLLSGAPVVDFPYLLSLLVLTALALWASNKLWTVERLLQCTSRGV